MQLANIQELVDKEVAARSEEVWQRLFSSIRTAVLVGKEHRRRAGLNGCNCTYCSTIVDYVRLKRQARRLHRLQEEGPWNVMSPQWLNLNQLITETEPRLLVAISRKNTVKKQALENELYISGH